MTLVFKEESWHYRLILWTWGKHFFEESHVDFKSLEDMKGEDVIKLGFDQLPVKWESKTVNFCPYCRAMVGAIITAPIVYLKRLVRPYKEPKNRTRADIMKASSRRTFMSLVFAGSINYGVGIFQAIRAEDILVAVPSFSIGTTLILAFWKREWFGKNLVKLAEWLPKIKFPKWQRKKKVKKVKAPKKPSKLIEKIKSKHDVICPPVHFIKTKDPETLR